MLKKYMTKLKIEVESESEEEVIIKKKKQPPKKNSVSI